MAGVVPASTTAPTSSKIHATASQSTTSSALKPSESSQSDNSTEEKAKFKLPSLRRTPKFSVKGVIKGNISAAAIHKAIIPPVEDDTTSDSDVLEEEEEIYEISQEAELTQRNLEITWEKFAAYKQKERPRLGYTLLASKPTLLNDSNVTFEVVNSYQKEEVMSIYNELTQFLRKSLEAPNIEVELIEVEADSSSAKPYTIEEKFKSMAAKNPAVLTLKQMLGLDFE